VTSRVLLDVRRADRGFHGTLDRRFVEMVPSLLAYAWVERDARRGKDVLSRQLAARSRILAAQCIGKPDIAEGEVVK